MWQTGLSIFIFIILTTMNLRIKAYIIFIFLSDIILSIDGSFMYNTNHQDQNQSHIEKIMTYNILNYDGEGNRDGYFKAIIDSISPDMIVVQELNGISGFNNFFNNILNVINLNEWSYADFIDQNANNDIALFYKSQNFSFINTSQVYTAQTNGTRNVVEWIMMHNEASIIFRIYGVHFKANQGYEDRRRIEMSILREYLNDLPLNTNFIVAGDFNVYNISTEPGFEIITSPSLDNSGQLFDPLNSIGEWHANIGQVNCEYSSLHTQSTRVLDLGDGATGGMDDRFDWILVSASILDDSNIINYIDESYLSFGNDGDHCNEAINAEENNSVSQTMADALHNASDHLPVIASFRFGSLDTATVKIDYEESDFYFHNEQKWYPNPFNSQSIFKYRLKNDEFVKIYLYDLFGRHVKTLMNQYQFAGQKVINWNGTDNKNKHLPSGIYFCILKIGQDERLSKLILVN